MLILFLLRLLSFLYLSETVCFSLDLSLRLSLDLLVSVHCPAAGTADSPSSRAAGHQLQKKPAAFTSTPPPPPSLVQERPCRDPCGKAQPSALSLCPGSCLFLQRQRQRSAPPWWCTDARLGA